jgi:hypothetical protein
MAFCLYDFEDSNLFADDALEKVKQHITNNNIQIACCELLKLDAESIKKTIIVLRDDWGLCNNGQYSLFIQTFIYIAALNRCKDIFVFYVANAKKYKIDLNFRYKNDMTLVMLLACDSDISWKMFDVLFQCEAQLNLVDSRNISALGFAILINNKDAISSLFHNGAQLSKKQYDLLKAYFASEICFDKERRKKEKQKRFDLGFDCYCNKIKRIKVGDLTADDKALIAEQNAREEIQRLFNAYDMAWEPKVLSTDFSPVQPFPSFEDNEVKEIIRA